MSNGILSGLKRGAGILLNASTGNAYLDEKERQADKKRALEDRQRAFDRQQGTDTLAREKFEFSKTPQAADIKGEFLNAINLRQQIANDPEAASKYSQWYN